MSATRFQRRLVILAIASSQTACFSWEPIALPRPAPQSVGYVRVLRTDGESLRLARTLVQPDSISGRRAGLFTTRRISVPVDSIQTLERRRTEWLQSAGLAVLMVIGTALSVVIAPPIGEP